MRSKKGFVTSTKQEKTLTVTVHRYENHPKYKKRYRISKKYHVDNPNSTAYEIGQEVTIYECRPISKTKKWTVEMPAVTKES